MMICFADYDDYWYPRPPGVSWGLSEVPGAVHGTYQAAGVRDAKVM